MKKVLLLFLLLFLFVACGSESEKEEEIFISSSLRSQDFGETSLKVKLTFTKGEDTQGFYSFDNEDIKVLGKEFESGTEIVIGENLEIGEEIKLNLLLSKGDEDIEETYIYRKVGLTFKISQEGGNFYDYIDLKLEASEFEETILKYSIGNIDVKNSGTNFNSGDIVRVGEDVEEGSSIDFNIYASFNGKELTQTYTFVKKTKTMKDIDNLRVYQVMICSFKDGDSSIGYTWQWNQGELSGGDIQGIIDSLDHIKGLGVNAIWMTPIFQTTSAYNATRNQAHNGYYANDYFNVDTRFGTNEKFEELVTKAHAKDMYIFLDGVFGHNAGGISTGNTYISPSPISGVQPTTSNPVNYQDADTLQYYKDVAYYWIRNYKIDGWRLDQSYQLGPGDTGDHHGQGNGRFYWDDIMESVNQAVSENELDGEKWGTLGYMVGEDWEGESGIVANTYGTSSAKGLESAFDFPMRYRIVQSLAREEWNEGRNSDRAENLSGGFDGQSVYPDWAHPNLMLGNHDLTRVGDLIDHSSVNGSNYWQRHKAMLSFQAAYSGPITIFYGEEVGLKTDIGSNDLTTLHISRIEGKTSNLNTNEQDLYDYVAKIMKVREEHPALWQEDTRTNILASGNHYVDYKYDSESEDKVVFALNCGDSTETFNFTVDGITSVKDVITGEVFAGSTFTIPMAGLQARFLIVE